MRAHFSFADADDATGVAGLERAAKFIAPDMTVITGTVPHERCHKYWRLIEACTDMELWRCKQSEIAKGFGADQSVINPARIMRVAGTVNYPNWAKLKKGYIPELVTLQVRNS